MQAALPNYHLRAQYPGIVIEVAYSQKKKRLRRLAEDYLLDSDVIVQVVVDYLTNHTPSIAILLRMCKSSIWKAIF
jgi:hypothetical protein